MLASAVSDLFCIFPVRWRREGHVIGDFMALGRTPVRCMAIEA